MTVSDWGPGSPAAVERDAPPSPPSSAVDARTPVPADTEERDGRTALSDDHSGSPTWAAIQALAALLEPEAFDSDVKAVPEWREPTQAVAVNHAAKVITSGYRLVSEDEATVERVARAMWAADLADFSAESGATMRATDENWVLACSTGAYQRAARAAVRALLDGER